MPPVAVLFILLGCIFIGAALAPIIQCKQRNLTFREWWNS